MNAQLYTMIRHHLREHPTQPVYIFDLDGTIADGSHRLDKLPTKDLHLTESWLEFNRLSAFDSPIESTIEVMNGLYKSGAFIIILTGRADDVVEDTTDWLHEAGAKYNVMVMRQSKDNRKDTVIKEEFLRFIGGLHRITAAWDDSPKVIEHFRSLGITTYQVCDYGDKLHAHLQSNGVDKLEECDHVWSQTIEDTHETCVSCGVSRPIPCQHDWERHSIADQYFNVCTKCGKQED